MAQLDANTLVLSLGGHTSDVLEFRASDIGGAVTITEAVVVNHANTSSNTSFTVELIRYSNAGTPAVIGTIAAAVGGTSDHWATNIPKNMVINDDHDVLESMEWIAVRQTEQNNGTATFGKVIVHYVGGKA
jgi:hypothetical protein